VAERTTIGYGGCEGCLNDLELDNQIFNGQLKEDRMRAMNALRRLLQNSDRLVSIDNRLAAIDEGIVNMSHDLNKRLERLAELQQAQLVMERDIVEAIERLAAATEARQ
jgi:chromosome segregation ATPase